jgi:hypothetical protein
MPPPIKRTKRRRSDSDSRIVPLTRRASGDARRPLPASGARSIGLQFSNSETVIVSQRFAHAGSTYSVVIRGLDDPRIHLLKGISRSGWIAGSSPAMTATSVRDERSLAPFAGINKHSFAISPHVLREVCHQCPALRNQRARGMPDARCTRSLVCAWGSKYAHEYSQRVTGITRHSPRNGLRLIPRSPR